MTAPLGHNSAAFGEMLQEDVERILGAADAEKLFLYVQWHVGDYTLGTQGMTLETEGAYQRFLMRLYARGKPLPDDDGVMAVTMSLSKTVWRRIKATLVALGKIIIRSGFLTNYRFEKERRRRAEQMLKQANAANARWDKRRKTSAPAEDEFLRTAAELNAYHSSISDISDKNINEINDTDGKNAYPNHKPITIKEEVPDRARERKDPENWAMLAFQGGVPEAKAQKEVWRTFDGSIDISENLRRQLAEEYPRVPIGPTLKIIRSESKIQDGAGKLLLDIHRKFSYAERDEINRDRRYAQHAVQKPPPTPRKETFYDERARETEDAWSKYDYSGKR